MRKFSDLVRPLLPGSYAFINGLKLLLKSNSYLQESGWFNTYKRGYPCSLDGSPLPWMNYPVIAFLEERLNKNMTLFEYGSGYSTFFYSTRVNSVISVEYNMVWYEKIKAQTNNNVHLIYQKYHPNGKYCRVALESNQRYDIIIVDGRDRVRCAINAFDALSTSGVIIFDDTDRDKYSKGINYYLENNFKKLDFEGLKPKGLKLNKTSILYRTGNCLDL